MAAPPLTDALAEGRARTLALVEQLSDADWGDEAPEPHLANLDHGLLGPAPAGAFNWDLPERRQIFSGVRLAWDP